MGHNLDLLLYGWSVGPPWFTIAQEGPGQGNYKAQNE